MLFIHIKGHFKPTVGIPDGNSIRVSPTTRHSGRKGMALLQDLAHRISQITMPKHHLPKTLKPYNNFKHELSPDTICCHNTEHSHSSSAYKSALYTDY